MLSIMEEMGVKIDFLGPNEVVLTGDRIRNYAPDNELARKLRGSVLLAAPLLSRFGRVELPFPGGDRIGRRRLDTHLLIFQEMGAAVEVTPTSYRITAPGRLHGADILLDEASVTATENAVMAAATADGTTIIRNAACEPHVQELCRALALAGADISGIGTNQLTINGVRSLSGADMPVGADYLEVGSFIVLAVATKSSITIDKASPEFLRMILFHFKRLGIEVKIEGDSIVVPADQSLEVVQDARGAIPKIEDAPWPGFPADLMSIALVAACQARGSVMIFEKMFESRLFFVDQLIDMGARIVLCDPHRAVVIGPSRMYGCPISSPDIRAGMALLIAALAAQGKSVMRNIEQIDRGYERIDERLRALGAKVDRIEE